MSIPEQFIQNLAEQCEPIPASPSPLRLSGQWLIEAIIYIGVSLLYLGVRPDIKLQLQSPSFYVEFFLLSTLIIMASFSAAALSYPDLYQRRKLIYLPFFTMALLVTFHAISRVTCWSGFLCHTKNGKYTLSFSRYHRHAVFSGYWFICDRFF